MNIYQFDEWLDKRRYIKRKRERNIIISKYKEYVRLGKTTEEFERELETLGYPEETISDISRYLSLWNYRKKEDEKVRREV